MALAGISICALSALVLWAAPGAAAALQVSYAADETKLRITADAGDKNVAIVQKVLMSDAIYVQESTPGVGVNAPDCFQPAVYAAECDAPLVTKVIVKLSDKADSLDVTDSSWPQAIRVSAFGGEGNDTLQTAGAADLLFGNEGKDWLFADAGKDKVRAKDGERDREIDCGPGNDALSLDAGLDPAPLSC
jgi:Ca2+-binding RTX toxin-like protein